MGLAFAAAPGGGSFAAVALFTGGSSKTTTTPNAPIPTTTAPSPTPPVGGVACGGTVPPRAATVPSFNGKFSSPPRMTIDTNKTYVATMKTSCGTIKLDLDPKTAPKTVNSLVFLIRQHFFDGTFFHRIVPNFVIQGGDPTGTGTGGPGYTVVDTPPQNAQYPVGTLAMAKTGSEPNGTSGSQFFIVTSSSAQQALAPGGTGQYAIAGKVISGLSVVYKISRVPVGGATGDQPQQKVYIEKATVTAK
jgi:peptidyl-prolyl cis-trans isomerase B (cyclophilin B)